MCQLNDSYIMDLKNIGSIGMHYIQWMSLFELVYVEW